VLQVAAGWADGLRSAWPCTVAGRAASASIQPNRGVRPVVLSCLVLAVRAIRRDDIVHHRRWMIRAFAIGIGIATTRIWLQVF
jgi:uncharacterized membrane protein YozB (DUF420 family)